jgi:NAD(P)-dependent dehydrogenase (short-subunit alcohol dehydrogenase family)
MMAEKKVLLITGCSSGIGLDAAHGMAARGWRVFATARAESDVERLRADGFEALQLDVTDRDSREAALNALLEATGGRIDALFNNAAFALPGAVEDLPEDGLRQVYETNVFGLHALTRLVLPHMREKGGTIVNNSSILGFIPLKWRGAYVSSKFALEGLTGVLRLEMADTPVRIVLIQPGPITSQIRQNSIPPFERWIDWETSPRAEQYRKTLLNRLYKDTGPDRFELPADAVTKVLARILESRNPKPRYRITTPTHIMAVLIRLLPARWLDAVLRRA